ncbi:MAG: flavodoxin reductase [Bacteroidetes bacterium]|nr:flavodoxin reductase [Bacteroidota bacterium]
MEQHIVKIKSIDKVTHDTLSIVTDKPKPFSFTPGQATEISINKKDWQYQRRPFTFTCIPENDFLEFTIKTYPAKKGVTNELLQLSKNDELILHDVFGSIAYKGEGVFIAGGAGVTPFISILRFLHSKNELRNNKLIFANKTKADIILEQQFKNILGKNFINILSAEKENGYAHGYITKEFLEKNITDFTKQFYLCGPDPMMEAVEKLLIELGVDSKSIIQEAF